MMDPIDLTEDPLFLDLPHPADARPREAHPLSSGDTSTNLDPTADSATLSP